MNKSDIQAIGSLIEEKLEPIKKTLNTHTNTLSEVTDKLDSLTLDMIEVQKKTDVIADIHDMLKDTKDKVDDHEQRIKVLEHAA